MGKDFEILEHMADFKIRVYGKTMRELFQHALIGMFQAIRPQNQDCVIKDGRLECPSLPISRKITLQSLDQETLLIDFLNEALYLSDIHNEAYLACDIHHLSEKEIEATIYGIKISGFEVVEIKAVTYHQLVIKHTDKGFQADVVFDV